MKNQKTKLQESLLFYLDYYYELVQTRPHYKKIVDKEIKALIKELKELGKQRNSQ